MMPHCSTQSKRWLGCVLMNSLTIGHYFSWTIYELRWNGETWATLSIPSDICYWISSLIIMCARLCIRYLLLLVRYIEYFILRAYIQQFSESSLVLTYHTCGLWAFYEIYNIREKWSVESIMSEPGMHVIYHTTRCVCVCVCVNRRRS